MKSHTSLVAQQTHLSEWAVGIKDCPNYLAHIILLKLYSI